MSACMKCKNVNSNTENLVRCGHKVCRECLCGHLGNLRSAKIVCPVDGCTKLLQDSLIRKCLSNNQILLYDQLCRAPNTVKCLIKQCPFFMGYTEKAGHFLCPICKQPNCLDCGLLHEENIKCQLVQNYNSESFEKTAAPILRALRKEDLKTSQQPDLIPNSDNFECLLCTYFFLPREGVSLRNCMDVFCKSCLESHVLSVDNINNLSCPNTDCCRPLTERECQVLLGNELLRNLSLKSVENRMFNCQAAGCNGLWDFGSSTDQHKCPRCGKHNCGYCKDIHEGLSCEQFRATKRFLEANAFLKSLVTQTTCHNCGQLLKKGKGCNAVKCPSCLLQICIYSGLEVGPNGCKCTNIKRCHPDCALGCAPDGVTPYEKKLQEFFMGPS